MVKIVMLKSKSFSKKCINEIKGHIPHIVGWIKMYVVDSGYVLYLKDKHGNTIAHAYKDNGEMMLSIKEVV